jgi:hypothetical protein
MDWSFKMQHDSCEAAASFDNLVRQGEINIRLTHLRLSPDPAMS